jgi:hypothetical protein
MSALIVALLVGAAAGGWVGWVVRGRRCGPLCPPGAASETVRGVDLDAFQRGAVAGVRWSRGSAGPGTAAMVRAALAVRRTHVDGPVLPPPVAARER